MFTVYGYSNSFFTSKKTHGSHRFRIYIIYYSFQFKKLSLYLKTAGHCNQDPHANPTCVSSTKSWLLEKKSDSSAHGNRVPARDRRRPFLGGWNKSQKKLSALAGLVYNSSNCYGQLFKTKPNLGRDLRNHWVSRFLSKWIIVTLWWRTASSEKTAFSTNSSSLD